MSYGILIIILNSTLFYLKKVVLGYEVRRGVEIQRQNTKESSKHICIQVL